ncbi:uncharacterized protein NPIL_321431 [Nephila pilipes]|uniref:CCHC-type domain-containing protein n=1 Tax=Nephila pilipes TaxID=299642 RepID=A0A8X6N9R2_NEPPI|nr:uncharacterized protein NPIL_321431 [Nephila pilipes]
MLYPVVESCLPTEILKAWDRYRLNREDKEDDPVVSQDKVLENLMIFLRHEVEGEEHHFLAETSFGDGMKRKESRKPPLRDEPTAATLIANTSVGRNQCIFCERAHASQDCQKISNLAYEDRKGQVMRKRCCLVCLKPGHMAKRCHNSVKCLICGRRHYALLCPDLRKDKISSKSREVDEEQNSTETLLTNLPLERKIYLKTITVRLRHKNKEICVRALMDDGSHRSYIVKSLVAELDLSPSGTEVLSQGLFGGGISPSMEYGRFTEQTMQIMNAASFELRSWAHTGIKHLESQNVLGLKWDTETDELYCVHPEADMGISDTISKRKLLSIVNSIYDHIGFTSPATLLPKLLLQEAWRNKLNWDEELPPDMQKRYQRWAKHLDLIERCRIPRKLFYGSFEKATLYIFTDASAHGAKQCSTSNDQSFQSEDLPKEQEETLKKTRLGRQMSLRKDWTYRLNFNFDFTMWDKSISSVTLAEIENKLSPEGEELHCAIVRSPAVGEFGNNSKHAGREIASPTNC